MLRVRFADERLAPADDDGVTVMLEQEGSNNQRVQLRRLSANRGVFEGSLADLTEGRYHAWIGAPTLEGAAPATDFLVARAPANSSASKQTLPNCSASGETRGQYFTLATVAQLGRSLPEGRQVPIETLQPVELWNRWPVVLARGARVKYCPRVSALARCN